MKKSCLVLSLLLAVFYRAAAEEGMWLPLLLGQQVYNDMVKKGLKLTRDQLYQVNKASVKDAVIIFGGGCTGAVVSPDGLIFTNHHCGNEVIAQASSVEHNYLKDGFYAKTRNEEIPCTLTVQFLLRIEDVTRAVMDSLSGLTGAERIQKQMVLLMNMNKRMSDPSEGVETRISSLFKGNQFLAFVYQRYTDVRLVGTPPEMVGDFGGETDNWQWPRHSGDFAIFRVYAGPGNKPAAYSSSNTPFKARWFFPLSIKGFKEGDFAMTWGYPGSTNRYETSWGVAMTTDISDPAFVRMADLRLKYMAAEMKNDPAEQLRLFSSYAVLGNSRKFFDGEARQLLKYNVYDQKKKNEEKFSAWAAQKPEYRNLFNDWTRAYDGWRNYARHRIYLNQGILGSPLMYFIWSYLLPVESALVKSGTPRDQLIRALDMADKGRKEFIDRENRTADKNALAESMRLFYTDIPKDQHPVGFYGTLKNQYGPPDNTATYLNYCNELFSRCFVFDDARWKQFVAHPDANVLQQDPAFNLVSAFYTNNYQSKYASLYQQFSNSNAEYGRLYLKGIMEMDTMKAKLMYPDATFTMRVSYGSVKSYRPRDAVYYDYLTTAKGILEKYKPGDPEFDIPPAALDLLKKKAFGQYADKQKNDLVIAFITTNDITGGNSGSPVLNGNGELIGLAFDGVFEAMNHKYSYDRDLNRTICVDIRYVLWCIDKLGGASNIINELRIVK